jgi:hypothetical protein
MRSRRQADEGVELRDAEAAKVPSAPLEREMRAHEAAAHVTYRSWRKRYIKDQAVNAPHYKRKEEEKERFAPDISMGYLFLTTTDQNEEEEGMPIMTMSNTEGKIIMADVRTNKGVSEYSARRVHRSVNSLAHERMTLQSDSEP